MSSLTLATGETVLFDDELAPWLRSFSWNRQRRDPGDPAAGYYARTKTRQGGHYVLMHRLILNPLPGIHVDHIDGNGLNNQSGNLRLCVTGENQWNRRKRQGMHAYKGIRFAKETKHAARPWAARIRVNGRDIFLGYHATPEAAAQAYDAAAREHFGSFACLNFQEAV